MTEWPWLVEAHISLRATESGGLRGPLPSGTRSLIMVFSPTENPIQIGAVIDVIDGVELIPGREDILVRMSFWAQEASEFAQPGSKFDIWYRRIVGEGQIVNVIRDAVD